MMVTLATLFAVLAVAVPTPRPASAADPTVAVEVIESSINYETAQVTITLSNIGGLVDANDDLDWILSVRWKADSEKHHRSLTGGPGYDHEPDFTDVPNSDGEITFTLTRLIPDSAHSVEAILYEEYNDVGQWMKKAEGSTTFDSKGGCYVHPDPDNDPAHDPKGPNNLQPKWFGGGFNFSTQEKAELTLDVYVTNSGLAGVNSGRCIYYKYRARGGADRGPFSAYVYTKSGGRRAWIKLTGLEMGTTYDFTVSFHPTLQDGNVGTQGTTLGPRMAVRSVNVDRITETSARATIEVDNPNSKTHTVYHRYYKTADADDSDLHVTGNANTVTDPIVFSLPSLTASTEYKMEASLQSYFPGTRSEFDVFPTKPNKPTGLTVTPGNEQLELEWTKPAGGDAIAEYIVQWKSGAQTFQNATEDAIDDREALVPHVPDTATFDTTIFGLDNGTLYTVHVIAKNESGQAASDREEGTPDVLPDKPTIQSVVEGHTQLEVTWDEPASTGSDISGYVVQWKDNSVSGWESPLGSAMLEKTVFTHTITSLANGTEYAVRVRAFNGLVLPDEDEDDYNWSDEKTGTPRPEPIVTGVTVAETSITRTTATATVAIDNQTSESQTVHLRHRVNTSGSSWTDATPKNTAGLSETFDLSSLTGNTEYLVEAWLAGTSSVKRSVTFRTSPVPSDAPSITQIAHGDGRLTVQWNAPTNTGGSGVTGYKVQWKSGIEAYDPNTRQDEPNASPHTIDQLANGTEYMVQVIAVTTAGDGSPSNSGKGTPSRKPYAPTIQSVTPGHTQLVVTWNEPADGGDPITKYKVEYKEQGAPSWRLHKEVDHNILTETIGSLTNGTTYVVQVSAKNVNGYGDLSAEKPGTPRPDPSVTGVTVAESSITRTTATATVAIDNQTGESQTVHLRHRVNTSGSSWTDATPKNTAGLSETFGLSSLTGHTEYLVEAWLASSSTVKRFVTFTTGPVEPDPPTITAIEHGDRELTVTWTKPGDGGSPITGYKIEWTVKGQNSWTSKIVNDPNALEGSTGQVLNNGTEYTVQIIAVNLVGDSQPSNHMHDTPRTIPDAPTITNVIPGDRKLTVIWSAPSEDGGADVTGYKVQWKDNSVTTDWDSSTGVTEVSASGLTREITSLTNDTTYGVRVRADNGVTSDAYNWAVDDGTPKPDPSIDSISVAGSTITQTTAIATVNIADHTGDALMVHLRYRVNSSSEAWTIPTPQSTITNSVAFPQFTGLKSDTEYGVEASFDGNFVNAVISKTFKTKRPTVSSVEIDENTITQAGATATVTIQEPNGKQQTVRLRYRPSTQNDWSTTATDAGEILVNTSTDVAAVPISDLTSGTLYDVEASLESDYSQSATTTFTTEGPSLTGITFSEVMQESAKATIGIQAPNGRSLPVFVRYRKVTDPVNEVWTRADTSGTDTTAMAPLSDLTSGTEYEVQASLEDTFLAADTVKETFTTHDPSLSGLTVMSVTLMGATLKVDIQAPNGESQTINYRYRPVIQTDWTITATDAGDGSLTSATESATFTLASLSSGTQYQVQASLDSDLVNPTLPVLEAKFTTLTPDPSISDVDIDAKQTTAKATITIANPGTSGNTVHLHFRVQNTNAWSSPALTSTTSTSEAAIDMTSLTERTVYEVEVALNSGFTSSTTVTFTTLVTPTITSVSVDDITKTTATATVAIANPDGTDRTVHLQYRIKDTTPAYTWTKAMEDSDTGSQEFGLSSLTPGTIYEVQASFDSNFVTGVEDTEFTTTYAPSISSVSVGSITKTTATAAVSIANPDGTSRTVHLQYREKDADPEDTWTKAMEDTDTGSQEFGLASLTPGTTYEVQASFDGGFSPHKDTTFTTVFEPSISAVGVGDIEKTTATATVVIANPDGTNKTVNLQYREYNQEPEAEWTKPTPEDTDTGSETFDLASLTPGTTYEVQASFGTNFDTYKDTTFTTKFAPTISAVRVDPDSITKTTASVIVTIANPDGTEQTVQLQYRIKDPQGNWSSTQTEDTTTGSATINLTGLTAGTTYDVEVSLASGFGDTQVTTFTTKFEPSISAVSIGSVTQTTASAAISIDNADGSTQTVHLQYREKDATPLASWTSAQPVNSTTSAASIPISGLTADKTYEVEAWLANDTAKKVTATFTTLKAPNGTPTPSVSSVGVSNITMTTATATVNIANPGNAQNTVNLRHSVDGEDIWTDHTKTETGSTVAIDLSSLTAGTTYEVEAWLSNDDTSKKVTATFTTSPAPSISSISVGSITRTSASATVNIANPGTAQNTVNLRYSVDDEDSWTDHTKTETGSTVSFPLSGLTAGTTYKVEAWLGSDTDNKAAATFTTTLPAAVLSPTINSVRVGNILETTATATVNIDNADGSTQTARLQYRTTNSQGNWSSTYENTSTTGTTIINFGGMTAGTRYQVQAWLASDASDKVTASFQTQQAAPNNPPPQRSPVNPTPPVTKSPEVASVSVTNETQTTADATVKIDNAGTAQNTVNLRYSVDGEDSWTDHTKTEAGSAVEFPLSSLTAGTAYEVEAWLGSDTGNKATVTFTTTLPAAVLSPIINSVRVGNILETTATATVNIDNADGSTQTAKLQYRTTNPQGNWSSTYENTSTTGTTIINFGGMTAGTRYQVQAWLASDASDKVTASFQTQQAAPNNPPPQRSPVNPTPPVTKSPEVASVSVTNETQTTADATVKIDNAGTAQNTVNLRYSVDGEDSWTDHTKSETGSAVEFPLSGLTAGTTYEVEAWLGSDTDNKVTATFMTTQADAVTPPSISSVRVLNIAQTNARVVVGLANANAEQRVYMKYKLSSAQWPTTSPQNTTHTNGSATFILSSLTAGTGYHTRVSLNSDMSDATTRSFTTTSPPPPQNPPPPRSPVVPPPSVSLITFNNETQTSADATVNIADAGTAKKTVRLHHRIEGTTDWSTPPKVMKNPGSSTTILLTGLTAGTTYEVQAWLNSNAPPTGTTVYTFNTLPNDPDISNLKMKNIRQTSATAMVEIADAGTGMKEVYLKHSIDGTDEWSQLPFPTITYADSTSIELTGLEEQTTYQVMVDLTDGFDKAKSSTFTTLAAPSLSGVSISSITRTGAVATATIADAGTAQKTMHLRYREFGETEWSTAQAKTTTGASAVFNLTGLDPRTTYEVQASLDIEFGTSKYAVFTTLSPDPSVSGVSVGSITQTSATTTVTIAYPGIARKTVHLRYRVSGETEWGAVQMKATSGGSAAIDLTGLSPRTMYEVEASLSSDFASSKTATFSTLSLDPSVSGVSIGSITQASAAATVTIANPGTAQKTVYLQYRVDGASEWSDSALTATTDGPSATIYMTGIIADTEYEVRASLASDFALAQHATFTTLRYPSIYDVDVTDVTKNTATAEIDIADPDGTDQTVHLRYRTTAPQGTWSNTLTTTSTTGEASIDLTGLTVDTEYEVEASLAADFAIAVSDTFRTLPPDPVVAEVSVNSIRQTTATAYIDISNANGSTQKVSLRYRTTTPRGNWSDIQTTTSTTDSASIDLSELTPGTEYDVQASLENSFPSSRTKHDTFTTLRWPSIASFEAENVARNGATVSATIADSRGVAQTVYVRHRATGYIAWRSTQQMDSVDDIASLRLRGLSSGTEYTAEASLDNSFPDGGTRSVTFTTKERDDEDAVDSDIAISTTRTTNVPLLGFTPQMLRFVAIEGGDNPAPQAFSVWNRAHGSMSFNLSNHEEWLSQQPMSGVSNGSDDPVTITASVDSSELASGQYVDVVNIDVTSSGKSPGQVIVVLDVLPPDYIRQFVSRDEGGIVVLPDGTVKIVVEPESPPKDVDIELMKLNLQAYGQPPGEQERVVVAIESNTYEPGGDTPEDVAYAPYLELWVQLPEEDAAACDEGKTRVYSVETGTWSLIEHRCETDESDKVWAVAQVERLGAFALVIDDAPVSPTPTPVAAAVAATATAIPASAPAVAVQRISLPAQPPTPTPISVPTPVPMPNGKTTVAPAMAPTPTPTAVPAGNEPSAPMMQASAGDGGSGGFGRIILAALGVPMLIGTLIVVYLLYRERRRRDDARMI